MPLKNDDFLLTDGHSFCNCRYTVLPYMVDYVIEPEYDSDGTKLNDAPYSSDTVFVLFGASLIVFQLVSIPLWLKLVSVLRIAT